MNTQTNTDSNDWLANILNQIGYRGYVAGIGRETPNSENLYKQSEISIERAEKAILAHISKHYIPKEQVDEMVRLAKCSHNNTTHRSTDGGGYYSDCYDCGARLMPWSLVEKAQLPTNKKGGE